MENSEGVTTLRSLHNLSVHLNDGSELELGSLKGKKLLIVNTASDCGYTDQYDDLQKLYETKNDKVMIIAFPANDFKEQEKGNDEEIASFCTLNYGVTFPLAKKSSVIGAGQNKVFEWLSSKEKNGWNEQQPTWNFSKYLVSEDGMLLQYFDPGISPMSKELRDLITK